MNDPKTIDEKMNSKQVLLLRKRLASPSKPVMMREQRGICKSAESGDEPPLQRVGPEKPAAGACERSGQGRCN